ncbi:MAG: hypothetical protein K6A92_12395 [Lachnospiraceae bacterium]|nr:hypothetical protein [Lachnospiraceae bacterium]
MNINLQGLNFLSRSGNKATMERLSRQEKRDATIAFLEQQKHNLKNMKADSLEEIKRKLELFQTYESQINATRAEYNHSQMFHLLDEARELGEEIAEAAEKMAPKTPEEYKEELLEEATGIEQDSGILPDGMDELEEQIEELAQQTEVETEESLEIQELTEEGELTVIAKEQTEGELIPEDAELTDIHKEEELLRKYRRIDYRI